MKGPDAAMVAAVRLLREHGLPERGRILVTLHGMHESGGNEPLHALIARGIHGDAVITGELGGGVHLPIAGLGLTFWEIVVERPGMALHETVVPPGTVDPVEVGRLVHAELVALRDRLAASPGRPGAGDDSRPSLFVAKFVSGDYYNRLPVRAELAGTRRHDESSDLAAVAAELEELVNRVRQATGAPIELQGRADRRGILGRSGRAARPRDGRRPPRSLRSRAPPLAVARRDECRPLRARGRDPGGRVRARIRRRTTATARCCR